MSNPENLSDAVKKTIYWSGVAASVLSGMRMHRGSGQLLSDPEYADQYNKLRLQPDVPAETILDLRRKSRPWGNITEHCLVQVARAEVLARWIGLPEGVIKDIRTAEILEDYSKRLEVEKTKKAEAEGGSPLWAYKQHVREAADQLRQAGFSEKVIYFANSPGGQIPELLETKRILDKTNLTDDDWGYLLVHYIDDCSIGSDCVLPIQTDLSGNQKNIIDFKSEQNKAKASYKRILEEVGEELKGTTFEGQHNQDVMVILSHEIERRLARRILKETGMEVNSLKIPELIDEKIKQSIQGIALRPTQSSF